MSIIVAAGSDSAPSFSVIEFTGAGAANVTLVPLGFGGCQLDLDGTDVAVGDSQGSQIRLYDVSNPASPVLLGEFDSALSGIGAIKISNRQVAAGELYNTFEARVVLIDFSTPSRPRMVGMASTPLLSAPGPTNQKFDVGSPVAISSVALASDVLVFAAGPIIQRSCVSTSVPLAIRSLRHCLRRVSRAHPPSMRTPCSSSRSATGTVRRSGSSTRTHGPWWRASRRAYSLSRPSRYRAS